MNCQDLTVVFNVNSLIPNATYNNQQQQLLERFYMVRTLALSGPLGAIGRQIPQVLSAAETKRMQSSSEDVGLIAC